MLQLIGLEISISRVSAAVTKDTTVIHLKPTRDTVGKALISYVIDPFLNDGKDISNDHTHFWESHCIVQCFLDAGYAVDVISFSNYGYTVDVDYDVFFGARTNFDHIASQLDASCLKIAHLDTAHWLTNNSAFNDRLKQLLKRRRAILNNSRYVTPNFAIEAADMGTVLGNDFTIASYAYSGKPLHRIPISVPHQYDWPSERSYDTARSKFLWIGASGFVHKGLDVVLEAFTQMPEYQLYVCGPLEQEHRFCEIYKRELNDTANINTVGWVDVASQKFIDLAYQCSGLVYPSSCEGGGGSAITAMHAGLLPILTREASVDIEEFGVLLPDARVGSIIDAVRRVASLPEEELVRRCNDAWRFARREHTRDLFAKNFREFVDQHVLSRTLEKTP